MPGNSSLMLSFAQAFERLLQRAPGPVFPRARQLYLRKYALEEDPQRFRTFLLEEEIQEAGGGALRIRAVAFAVVHWQAPRIELPHYATYLQQRWRLRPEDLALVEGQEWFREGGAFARFSAPAVYERAAPTTTLVSPSADPAAPAADPGSSR
jgi:hypothetical protein